MVIVVAVEAKLAPVPAPLLTVSGLSADVFEKKKGSQLMPPGVDVPLELGDSGP
jgi:hypothetical protein